MLEGLRMCFTERKITEIVIQVIEVGKKSSMLIICKVHYLNLSNVEAIQPKIQFSLSYNNRCFFMVDVSFNNRCCKLFLDCI